MTRLGGLTPTQLRSVERTLSAGTWTITAGAVLFSVLTVTPLVQRVTPDSWDWTAPILPIVVDAAVVIVIRMDATVSRLGESGGRWPAFLRWLTGCMTLALNIGDSALKGDGVGVAVHAVAPLLLIVTAEAALAYRHAITRALDRIAREQREEEERKRREHREREQRERTERLEREQREREEREAREHRERQEREQAQAARERREREEREHQLRAAREQREEERERREWEAAQQREREEREREERRAEQERQRREQQERTRLEDQRRAREATERAERARMEQAQRLQARRPRREHPADAPEGVREQAPAPTANAPKAVANTSANTPNGSTANTPDKMPEAQARATVVAGVAEGAGVRELARRTGWSLAWVSERVRETRGEHPAEDQAVAA
ncbi:DUF2637 domain-containing protein [Streptomyces diastaticus]